MFGNVSSDSLQTSIDGILAAFTGKTTATRSLLHSETECTWSVNNFWSCIFGNQGIARIFEHIAELLTALIGKNTVYQRKNTYSKIINIAHCKTCKIKLLAVVYAILIRYYYPTATTRD